MITKAEYEAGATQAIFLGQLLQEIPTAEMIRAICHADAMGPILDPTAYRGAATRMHALREYLSALQQAQAAFRRFQRGVVDTEELAARTREIMERK